MSWCWALGLQRWLHGSGPHLLERTATQLGRALSSERWGQQVSKVSNDSVKTGVIVEKQEPGPKQSEALLLPGRTQTACFLMCTHTVAAWVLSSTHFISSPLFRTPLGNGRDMQVGWWNHWTLCISYGAYWDTGRERRSGLLSPALGEQGLSFLPALSLKLHFQFRITTHPELNPQLRTHWERRHNLTYIYI